MDDTERTLIDLARRGYSAYGDHAGWRNYAGLPMPRWEQLGDPIRAHWVHAVCGILDAADNLGARDFVAAVDEAIDRIDPGQ